VNQLPWALSAISGEKDRHSARNAHLALAQNSASAFCSLGLQRPRGGAAADHCRRTIELPTNIVGLPKPPREISSSVLLPQPPPYRRRSRYRRRSVAAPTRLVRDVGQHVFLGKIAIVAQ